ncbi:VOC family protein [Flavobacterium sp. '19STA2R22 D10 B1']|uniref:VOC family protein n=1 Tax=Flavobacterium aerium TaxID=3037261 RepID=UPI00278C2BEB|nr:VOC family protein [Flavobacterium sp. '19STA2R22 D10 B1']
MTFRYARHTTDLHKIEKFYTEIVGLQKIGGFENHKNYNGLFLGHKNSNWHLEFTTSTDKPNNKFDEDDILVFYLNSTIELTEIEKRIKLRNINLEVPKNPYWADNGIMISDPDNFKVIFSVRQLDFNSKDDLTNLIIDKGIKNWSELIEFTRNLPYGRNLNRKDFSLVIKENKGTCSSKHSFLKKIADLNNFDSVKLILGMYRMNNLNTPKIGNTILESGLEYIPEAHCYLKLDNQRIDITNSNSDIENLTRDIILEVEIEPEQVDTFKVNFHKNYLKNWINENEIKMDFDRVWEIREQCIKKLEE